MPALAWKISTFAALGAAAYFALHPVRGSANTAGKAAFAGAPSTTSAPGSLFGWFGGSPASAAAQAPAGSPEKLLAQLRAAHNATVICDTLRSLGPVADEEATSAIADVAQKGRIGARECAVTTLGGIRLAAARSWLAELVSDKDASIRRAAVEALAARPDDPEARSIVLTVATTAEPELKMAATLALGNAHATEATPLLLAAMDNADLGTQRQIVAALGATGDAGAVEALAKISREGSTGVRTEALTALGKIGGPQAVTLLSAALLDASGADVRSAATALAEMDDPGAKKALLTAAESDRRDVSGAAMDALADVDGDDVRALMLKKLGPGSPDAHAAAARYFRSHPDEAVVADLSSMARHGGREASAEALTALAAIGGKDALAAITELASEPGTSQNGALSQLASMPGGREGARKIALSLLRSGGPAAHTAVSLLSEDASPEGRQALLDAARAGDGTSAEAMSALARRGDPASVKALSDLAQTGKDARTKAEALSALGQSGDPQVAGTLTRALKDSDPQVRRAAMDGLSTIGGPEAEKAVLDATSSNDHDLRTAAVHALGRNASSPAAAARLEKLAADPDREVANAAFWGLASTSPDKAAKIAEGQMKSADVDVRRSTMQVCHMLEPERARELLLGGLADADPTVAVTAAHNLTQIGDTASQNALAALLTRDDANPQVRRAAADALGEIGGETARRFADLIAQHGSAGRGDGAVIIDREE